MAVVESRKVPIGSIEHSGVILSSGQCKVECELSSGSRAMWTEVNRERGDRDRPAISAHSFRAGKNTILVVFLRKTPSDLCPLVFPNSTNRSRFHTPMFRWVDY